jgi:uncharacterized protein (TIGR00369 family)
MNERAPEIGVSPRDVLLSYDGLGFLRAIVDGSLPQPPITALLGFRLVGAEHGKAIFEGTPEFRHYSPLGVVHAGFAATLLDSAVACSVQTTLAKGETYTTLELKLNLVRPLTQETGPVRAEGNVIHRGRTTATADGQLRDRAGKLYAHASTTCMIFPAKS